MTPSELRREAYARYLGAAGEAGDARGRERPTEFAAKLISM